MRSKAKQIQRLKIEAPSTCTIFLLKTQKFFSVFPMKSVTENGIFSKTMAVEFNFVMSLFSKVPFSDVHSRTQKRRFHKFLVNGRPMWKVKVEFLNENKYKWTGLKNRFKNTRTNKLINKYSSQRLLAKESVAFSLKARFKKFSWFLFLWKWAWVKKKEKWKIQRMNLTIY